MKGIKYVNFIEISVVVIEIRVVENSELAVPVNNIRTCVPCGFLAADAQPCVLIPFRADTVTFMTNIVHLEAIIRGQLLCINMWLLIRKL